MFRRFTVGDKVTCLLTHMSWTPEQCQDCLEIPVFYFIFQGKNLTLT